MKLKNRQRGFLGSLFKGAAKLLGSTAFGNAVPLISSAFSLFGGQQRNQAQAQQAALANQFSQTSTAQQMAFQESEARKAEQFSERMSSTAHQRAIKDLRKAGLNPILAARYGGASAPSGVTSSGSSFTGQQANVQDVYTPAMAQGIAAASARAQIQNTQADTGLKTAQKRATETQSVLTEGQQIKTTSERKQIDQNIKNLTEEQFIKKQQQAINVIEIKYKQIKNQHDREILRQLKRKMSEVKAKEKFWSKVGPYMLYADKAIKSVAGLAAVAAIYKTFQGFKKGGAMFDKAWKLQPKDYWRK